ncbi:hypothetical protein BLNAU_18112 [Blattamonas nauphoetae]|uniref:Uncharacterized protein n=1 Tax=Blattamonas nauphoetae TaxID=2049346 RepID=A0ABQ9X5B5_9EUKA|nr:hypothetical protein BLNAU_18112 [Blattamonas nauphoetae]
MPTQANLTTSIEWDRRLVLQDCIGMDEIGEGCLSLFGHVDSEMTLSPVDINHAIRFLLYATIHIRYHQDDSKVLFEYLFPNCCLSMELASTLLKLISLPCDALKHAFIAFYDTLHLYSSPSFTISEGTTGFMSGLFSVLKPHEIPVNSQTMELHGHLLSILSRHLQILQPGNLRLCLNEMTLPSRSSELASEITESIFQPFCAYLRHIFNNPVTFPGRPLEPSSVSIMTLIHPRVIFGDPQLAPSDITRLCNRLRTVLPSAIEYSNDHPFSDELLEYLLCDENNPTIDHSKIYPSPFPDIQRFFVDILGELSSAFASVLGLTDVNKAQRYLILDPTKLEDNRVWVEGLECLLSQIETKTTFSDMELQSILFFLNRHPPETKIYITECDTISVSMMKIIVSRSSCLHVRSLWTLFTPSQPRHAPLVLTTFREFVNTIDNGRHRTRIGWLTRFFEVVQPATLPFTSEFLPFHSQLTAFLTEIVVSVNRRSWSDRINLSFLTLMMDYSIHLSLHPFALEQCKQNLILDFLALLFDQDSSTDETHQYFPILKQKMNKAALSSPSPPFILTAELVCSLSNKETINVLDRIVDLLDNDSPIDDNTILSICAFFSQSKKIDFVRAHWIVSRTKEQYLHALKSLLSLPVDILQQAPVEHLLHTGPSLYSPLNDNWDDLWA